MTSSASRPADRPGAPARRWLPSVLIVLAALVAHGGCLGSTFYLDDWTQIVDNDGVDGGRWWTLGLRALTYFTYWLTDRVFGMSAPAFHAGNLLLHTGVALAVFGFGREFLTEAAGLPPDRARRVGAWAGGLFAVHPLCSEIPNYARARDIALVSLFTVLTAWAVLRWRRRGGWRWLAAALAALLAATFSKEVGLVVAGGTAALVWVGVRRPEQRRRVQRPGGIAFAVPLALALGGLLVCTTVAAWRSAVWFYLSPLWNTVSNSLTGQRLGWHLLTQARVFWMYGWRVLLPIRLCSDHQIAWTVSLGDGMAWLAAAGVLGVLGGTAALWFRARTRPLALLLTLVWLAILHRLAGVSSELMVEYRMYPAMAFLCVALAWGFDRLSTRPGFGWARPALLASALVVCTVLSLLRTRDWRSAETLAANVTAQYPLQARARQEVQEADIRAGRWASVLARREGIIRALDAMTAFNQAQPLRRYDYSLAVLTRVSTEGNCALALAHLGHGGAAFAHLSQLMEDLRDNDMTGAIYLSTVYYARGMVHEALGQDADAAKDLRRSADLTPFFNVPQRELQRLAAREKQ